MCSTAPIPGTAKQAASCSGVFQHKVATKSPRRRPHDGPRQRSTRSHQSRCCAVSLRRGGLVSLARRSDVDYHRLSVKQRAPARTTSPVPFRLCTSTARARGRLERVRRASYPKRFELPDERADHARTCCAKSAIQADELDRVLGKVEATASGPPSAARLRSPPLSTWRQSAESSRRCRRVLECPEARRARRPRCRSPRTGIGTRRT